ncbi:MAG: DUF3011 domain-containing protein [Betaproteobacteria bacterium]
MRNIRVGLAVFALGAFAPLAANAQEVSCQSRNFQHQFCPTAGEVVQATLARQESKASCIQGRTWGWNNSGVWVSNGCSGRFRVETFRPGPPWSGGDRMSCDSRNFQYAFCAVPARVFNAELIRQRSQRDCIVGRTWGWREDGVWVTNGCQADFRVRTEFRPTPPVGPGVISCESRSFRYSFCSTGPIVSAQLLEQRSKASCVRGRSWGTTGDGIWVDDGCSATFRIRGRW